MNNSLSSLHPNPGWNPTDSDPSNIAPVGKHCILELYDCSAHKLDDEAFLRSTITSAVQLAGATLLNLISHKFEPQGVTCLELVRALDAADYNLRSFRRETLNH